MNDVERELRDLGDRVGGEVTYGAVPARKIAQRARLRRGLVVAVSTAAVVVVAAVAYPSIGQLLRDGRGERVSDLAVAMDATEDAGTARVELDFAMTFDGRETKTRAVGKMDFERRRSYVVMQQVGFDELRVEIISIEDTTFQRTLGGPGEESSKWQRLDLPDGAAPFGAGSSPADFLDELEAMAAEVTELGEEELDGIPVIHYRARIDPDAAPVTGSLPGSTEVHFDPMDVWVDELGRLRKLTFGAVLDEGSDNEAGMEMTMRLWDFGVPVDVVAPEPEDVTDDLDAGEDGSGYAGAAATSDTKFVYGKAGLSSPFLTLSGGDAARLLCVQGGPAGVTRGTLLHDATGRIVASFAPQRDARGYTVICAPPGIGHETVDAVLENPNGHTLRLETHHGDEVVVPLRTTAGRS